MLKLLEGELSIRYILFLCFEVTFQVGKLVVKSDKDSFFAPELRFGSLMITLQ